jgi:hypothetical protein
VIVDEKLYQQLKRMDFVAESMQGYAWRRQSSQAPIDHYGRRDVSNYYCYYMEMANIIFRGHSIRKNWKSETVRNRIMQMLSLSSFVYSVVYSVDISYRMWVSACCFAMRLDCLLGYLYLNCAADYLINYGRYYSCTYHWYN